MELGTDLGISFFFWAELFRLFFIRSGFNKIGVVEGGGGGRRGTWCLGYFFFERGFWGE